MDFSTLFDLGGKKGKYLSPGVKSFKTTQHPGHERTSLLLGEIELEANRTRNYRI